MVLIACEDVIHLDLSDIQNQIVIEGIVSDSPASSKVTVSVTQNAYQKPQSSNLLGATVTLSDDQGTTEIVKEGQTGVFVPTTISGVPGRAYRLSVSVGGQVFTADSRMPAPMTLDSIRSVTSTSWLTFGSTTLRYYLTDNPTIDEFCVIKAYCLNSSSFVWTVYSDKYANGSHVMVESPEFSPTNATVVVEVYSVDKAVYDYFYSLRLVAGTSLSLPDLLRMSDYNPKSNISNNALGYFSAQTMRRYIVQLH